MGLSVSIELPSGDTRTYCRIGSPFDKNSGLTVEVLQYKDKAARDADKSATIDRFLLTDDETKQLVELVAPTLYTMIKTREAYKDATDVLETTSETTEATT